MSGILPPFTTVSRKTRVKKVRAKVRPGRLKGKDMEELRRLCFERDGYRCQAIKSPLWARVDGEAEYVGLLRGKCLRPVIWERGFPNSGHMAHIVSRGRGGKDELSNVITKCPECHMVREHAYGPSGVKPCPKKPVISAGRQERA